VDSSAMCDMVNLLEKKIIVSCDDDDDGQQHIKSKRDCEVF
jgi:hypothetical protein